MGPFASTEAEFALFCFQQVYGWSGIKTDNQICNQTYCKLIITVGSKYLNLNKQVNMHLNRIQASWSQADEHALTTYPGRSKKGVNSEPVKVCSCCHQQIDKDPIPLTENSRLLQCLGFGFPLYFIFIKYVLIMLFLLVISYNCLSISWAIERNWDFCLKNVPLRDGKGKEIHCTSWMILLSRLEYDVHTDENIIRGTSFIMQLFFLFYLRDRLRKLNSSYQQSRESLVSDYAILVSNLPKMTGVGRKLRQLFNHLIKKIFFITHLEEYYGIKQKLQHLSSDIRKLQNEEQIASDHNEQLANLFKQMNILTEKMVKIENETIEKAQKDEAVCEKAIVVVQTRLQRQQILSTTIDRQVLMRIFGEEGTNIRIEQAPDASQIIWQNINIPKASKIHGLILGWTLFFIILAVITTSFYFIIRFKAKEVEHALEIYKKYPIQSRQLMVVATFVAFLSILIIVLFNKLFFATLLHFITKLEKHKTAAAFQLSLSIKYAAGLVFTTAIMTLLVENVTYHNIYQHDYGVIEEETLMFFMNAFLVPFIWFVNPWNILKSLKRFFMKGDKRYSQAEANELMQKPEYNLGKRYAQIIESVWFTYLYASLIPIGAVLILIGLAIFYWVDKYNLLRNSSVKKNVSGVLSKKAQIMLDLTLVIKPAGQLIFDGSIRAECNYLSVVCFCIGLLYLLLPLDNIIDWIHDENFAKKEQNEKTIDQKLLWGYELCHPLFSSKKSRKTSPSTSTAEEEEEIQRQKMPQFMIQDKVPLLQQEGLIVVAPSIRQFSVQQQR